MTVVEQTPTAPAYVPPMVALPKAEHRIGSLDGIRGIAVLLVVFGHAGFDGFNGAVGVDIFFVLSGYLITAILLNELKKTGKINFLNFYMRRVLRLMPALVLMVVLYLIGCRILGKNMGRAFGDAGIALVYASNWTRAFGNRPTFLGHTWSLSIEEQFYLVWPVTVVGLFFLSQKVRRGTSAAIVSLTRPLARSRGAVARRLARLGFKGPAIMAALVGVLVCLIGVAVIILHRHFLLQRSVGIWDQETINRNFYRVYFGLDTRGDSLLMGSALAFWTPKLTKVLAAIVGWIGLFAMAWYVLRLEMQLTGVFPNGHVLCAIFINGKAYHIPWFLKTTGYPFAPISAWTVVLLLGLVNYRHGLLAWLLSFKPLAWVGVISYGLYLYHFPIMTQMGKTEWKWSSWSVAMWGIPLSFAIATASFYLLEKPCLKLKDRFRSDTKRRKSEVQLSGAEDAART